MVRTFFGTHRELEHRGLAFLLLRESHMSDLPQLVRDDPWLEPYASQISHRLERFQSHWETVGQQGAESGVPFTRWHKLIGLHLNDEGTQTLREWAPGARRVELISEDNDWSGDNDVFERSEDGIWKLELAARALSHGTKYKLRVTGADGQAMDRIPSTAGYVVQDSETHDFCAQVYAPSEQYEWQHKAPAVPDSPLIYEAHVGMAGEEERVHTYREFADEMLPRIAANGYNTIQLMAVAEHPYYGSFGYHVSNFFAPSSRFGTPDDLRYLIDMAHGAGLTVLMDIVHSHAVKNLAEGLNHFDGTDHQYFHGGERGDHPQWDSKLFNYAKPEVQAFLLSNVRFWMEDFRFDGFRFDGVTSMLYFHHGMTEFDHYDKYFVDQVDDDAILYLQLAASVARSVKPDAILVAEDMSGMPGLCRQIPDGGLGFTHRLAMGIPDYWIKLVKEQRDEDWDLEALWGTLSNRRYGEPTIAYAESHDQALVGDKTLAFWLMDQEMYWHMKVEEQTHPIIERGIALHKIIRLITAFVGGEGYLTFIGNEFGHPEWVDFPREGNDWSFAHCRRLWSLAQDPELRYRQMLAFDYDLIPFLSNNDILSADPAQRMHIHGGDRVMAMERNNRVLVVNLSPDRAFTDYGIPVTHEGPYRIVLHTDDPSQGGHGRFDTAMEYAEVDGRVQLYLPPRTALVLAPC